MMKLGAVLLAVLLGCAFSILYITRLSGHITPDISQDVLVESNWHSMPILQTPDFRAINRFAETGQKPLSATHIDCAKSLKSMDAIEYFAKNGALPCTHTVVPDTRPVVAMVSRRRVASKPAVVYTNPYASNQWPAVQPKIVTKMLPASVTLYGDLNYDPLFLSLDKLRRKQLKDQDTIHNLTSQYAEVPRFRKGWAGASLPRHSYLRRWWSLAPPRYGA